MKSLLAIQSGAVVGILSDTIENRVEMAGFGYDVVTVSREVAAESYGKPWPDVTKLLADLRAVIEISDQATPDDVVGVVKAMWGEMQRLQNGHRRYEMLRRLSAMDWCVLMMHYAKDGEPFDALVFDDLVDAIEVAE